jgi:hypothetical protein
MAGPGGVSSLLELVEPGPGIKLVVGALGSSPYMLRALQRRSISQASFARIAFISAAEGSSDVGLALNDGLRSNLIASGSG